MFDALGRWLSRRGDALPLTLNRRRIFIVPTGSGLLFALVLCVMLLGAINYNLSLGHALVFLLAGLGVVAMLHTYRNLAALGLAPARCEAVFAGHNAAFEIVVDNPSAYPRRALDLSFGKNAGVRVDLPAGGKTRVAIPCPAPLRGRLDPGHMTLSTRYPLGFFRAWSRVHPRLSAVVYAQPITTPLPLLSAAGQPGQRHGETGHEDFTGLRLRQPNDSPRHIAWKALARDADKRPLLIKQFAGGGAGELWLDWALLGGGGVETRLSLLTGWVIAAEQAQMPYGLRLPGFEIAPDQGESHRAACLETLALYGLE